jgi:iron complex outermembrane receptor protein
LKQFARKPASLTLAVAIAQLFAPATVYAADAAPAATGAIEEVVVTAQKRKENLQNVPISIQALGVKDIEKHNIVTLSDIGAEVPGLNLAPYPGSSEAFFPTFRGITTNAVFISAPNPVAFHVDGVFRSQLVGLNNAAGDIERIEVLKGPQGVLSGRNATGGAVNVHYAKADLGDFGFKQQFTFANRGQFLSKTIVNLPIKDDLAMKLSYLHRQKDDDGVTNTAPGGVQFGKMNGEAYRLDVRWKPVSAVMVDYAYENSETKSYDTPPQCLVPGDHIAFGNYLSAFMGDPRVAQFVAGCSRSKLDKLYVAGNYEKNSNKTESHTLNLNWEVSPTFSLRSITGYNKVDTSNHYNYGAYANGAVLRSDSIPVTVPLASGGSLQLGHPMTLFNEAWSQEFQFLGDVGKTLKYTAGVFFSSEEGRQHSGPNIGVYIPDVLGQNLPASPDLLMIDEKGLSSAKSDSWATFAQVSWSPDALDNKLEIVPGLRYTRDHRSAVGYNTGWTTTYGINPMTGTAQVSFPSGAPSMTNAVGDRKWSKMTPAVAFNYHWQKDLMTYAKYSTAYTSGGFDPIAGPSMGAANFAKGFEPETIKSFELGMKGEFLDRRLRTNMALFQSKFTNEQKSTAQASNGWQTVNVGGSTYNGFEFDLTAAITRELRLSLNYAYLHHKYDKWIDPVSGQDVAAKRDLVVPKNDYAINLDYRVPDFGLPGKLDLNLNYNHRDASSTPIDVTVPWTPDAHTPLTTPAYSLWNARLALSQIKAGPKDEGRVTVALWAKNLTNKKYLIMANPGWVTDMSGNWGEPRTVGLDLTYKY